MNPSEIRCHAFYRHRVGPQPPKLEPERTTAYYPLLLQGDRPLSNQLRLPILKNEWRLSGLTDRSANDRDRAHC